MDSKSVVFAAVVVGLLVLGAAALVATALFVARRMMLDRVLREWSVSREVGPNRWSWLAAVCSTLSLVAIVTAFAAVLGATEPSRLLSSPWAVVVCTGMLVGFIALAVSSSPRRNDVDTRMGEGRGPAGTAARSNEAERRRAA